jgi:hypothetical protein
VRRERRSDQEKQSSLTDWDRIDATRDEDIDTSEVPPPLLQGDGGEDAASHGVLSARLHRSSGTPWRHFAADEGN